MAFHREGCTPFDRKGIILVSNDLVNTAPAARRRFGSFPPISLFTRSQIVLDRTPHRDFLLDSKIYPEEYLVESCGELLLVQRCRSGGHCEPEKVNFKVYKILEEEVRKECWCPLMIWGTRCSLWGRAAPRSESGFFLKNWIYFIFITGRFDAGNAFLLPKSLKKPSVDSHVT